MIRLHNTYRAALNDFRNPNSGDKAGPAVLRPVVGGYLVFDHLYETLGHETTRRAK